MASNSEKLLLKQITDLTRQIEMQKNDFRNQKYPAKNPSKSWDKKYTKCVLNSYQNGSRQWHKPLALTCSSAPLGTQTVHERPTSDIASSAHSGSGMLAVPESTKMAAKQVFINPNFVPGVVATSVHINPNFRPCASAPRSPDTAAGRTPPAAPCPGAGTAAGVPAISAAVARPAGPAALSAAAGPPSSAAGRRVVAVCPGSAGGPSSPARTGFPAPPVDSVAARPAGTAARPAAAVSVGASERHPIATGPARRRSRSLSSIYRVLTKRKLVRRLSKDTKTPPAPAATRRPAVLTRHKLVRVLPAARSSQPAKKWTGTRHKLVRVTTTPRSRRQPFDLSAQKAGPGASGSSPRTPSAVYRPGGAGPVGGRYGPARSWRRRRSSSSTPASRLTSAGSLRLGSTRFVNIGGLLYKATARKLQRAVTRPLPKNNSLTPKATAAATAVASAASPAAAAASRPRCISVRGTRYRVEAGGRSLRRLEPSTPAPPRLDIGGVTFRRSADGTLTADRRQQASRTLLSRAKSRSLAVLRLSRQPCRFYCRLGRCQRHERRQCPHVHDPGLRPVCTRHLQGGCRRPGCSYNHAPRPEKVPHCVHFITAECRRDDCPYMHVNVDADAPLCARFLAGYCARGQQCTDKHLYICPEFSEGGSCPRGGSCPLAHRARRRRLRRLSERTAAAAPVAPPRGTSRYYLDPEAGQRPDAPPDDRETDGDGGRPGLAELPSFIAIGDQSSGDEE